jgi:hypothetical protein
MDCLSLSGGEDLLARCTSELASLDWRAWFTTSPAWLVALLAGAPLLLPWLRRWRRKMEWQQVAHRRAEQLLRERLTPSEHRRLQKYGYLDMPSRIEAQRCYRIPRHRGRVHVLEAIMLGDTLLWRKAAELCVVSMDDVPDADLVLSHKWMIEGDEAGYLALANWIRLPDTDWTLHVAVQPQVHAQVADRVQR